MPKWPPAMLLPDLEDQYTQTRSILTALERSPRMRIALQKIVAARAQYLQQQAARNFQFVLSNNLYAQPAIGTTQTIGARSLSLTTTETLSSQFALNMQLLLTTFGRVENQVAAAFLNIEAQARSADIDRRDLILLAKESFFNHMNAVASLATAQLNLESCQQTLDDSRQMFRQGLLSRYDVVQAELQVTQAQQQVAQAGTDVQTTLAQYLNTLFLPRETPVRLVPPDPIIVDRGTTMEALQRVALVRRPDLQSLDRQLAVARKLLVAAQNTSNPTVNLSFGYQTYPGNKNSGQDQPVALLSVQWPFMDGGLRRADILSARSQLQSLEAQADLTKAQVVVEVEKAWRSFAQTEYDLHTAVKQVETAAVYYDMARQRYVNGLGTSLETQDALRSLNSTRIQLVVATLNRDMAFARLEQSLGVDFPDRHLVLTAPMFEPSGPGGQAR